MTEADIRFPARPTPETAKKANGYTAGHILRTHIHKREKMAQTHKGSINGTSKGANKSLPTSTGCTGDFPMPPKACFPRRIAVIEAKATFHNGVSNGNSRARKRPVKKAEPSRTDIYSFRNVCQKYSESRAQRAPTTNIPAKCTLYSAFL